jgi:hypothetical protein
LYPQPARADIDRGKWIDIDGLRRDILETRPSTGPAPLRAVEFGVYSAIAMLIHAAIAIPAVIVRFVTDITLGYSVFQAVKPKKRADLY